eukprot:GFYU01023654.1.p1 GENE.GFYU01023654.1~~GFYU01023654.1.p1  ORF type:complete len:411 (+),score=98.93 GFYU01023654.1:59-1291(+)
MDKLNSLLEGVNSSVANNSGRDVAGILALPLGSNKQRWHPGLLDYLRQIDENDIRQLQRRVRAPYDQVVIHILLAVQGLTKRTYEDAFNNMNVALQNFHSVFQQDSDNWAVPILHRISEDVRLTALLANYQMKQQNLKGDKLSEAERTIKKGFTHCWGDRSELSISKKPSALRIVNILFKIYFQVNIRLCKNLIRFVEDARFQRDVFPTIPQSHRVTYRFYVGCLALFDNELEKAETDLSYAFDHCHRKSFKNKQLILHFLVPIKMLHGKMPSMKLLAKYKIPQFMDLVSAVREGNLNKFTAAMHKHQEFFIRKGVHLMLEKLKLLVYRNLFKKVFIINNKDTRLTVQAFQVALRVAQVDMGEDEIECVLANLMYRDLMKGYVAHAQKKVVLSKAAAFPGIQLSHMKELL